MMTNRRLTKWLESASPVVFASYCIAAAFGTYFCMYAFRKPFAAGTYEGAQWSGVALKTLLVVAQVSGYTLSKFIGIKVISEMSPQRRAVGILGLIAAAQISLFFFAVVPAPLNVVFLFLNGLPLGMVFGLVLSFLEGRRLTEALAAGLCASFIVSSGVMKSIGRYLIVEAGVSEYWMPCLTGLLFLLPTLFFVWLLDQIPAPTTADVTHRSARAPMTAAQRRRVFAQLSVGLVTLVTAYVALTIMRSVRDDFAVEIWRDMGEHEQPAVFAQSELAVMFVVILVGGLAILIADNRQALRFALGTVIAGFVLVVLSMIGYQSGWLGSFPFMVLSGVGMYIPYVVFHTTVFERIIAVFRSNANIGYLMYLADAAGYLGYVAVMLAKNFGWQTDDYVGFFVRSSLVLSVLSVLLVGTGLAYFEGRLARLARTTVVQGGEA